MGENVTRPKMNAFLFQHWDYLVLVLATGLLFGCVQRYVWRAENRLLKGVAYSLAITVLVGGWFLVERATRDERARMQQMVEGYALTYAQEIGLMGHAEITKDTSADDPRYWRMIAAEKRWLAANRSVNDIYTFRKNADGKIALIVDSETDYNRDGLFNEDREKRTPIGEIYEGNLGEVVDAALAGHLVFQDEPSTDRWGTWVTAVAPIRDFRGGVEAVLGVDFDASTWVAATQRVRWTTIGYLAAVLLVIAIGSGALGFQTVTRNLQSRLREQDGVRREKQKLETLVNTIGGIVWEVDARSLAFTFISRQCETILGYPQNDWLTVKDFWDTKLHPDDHWARERCAAVVAAKKPYSYDYRMIAADGRTVWIRESAAVMLDDADEPVLIHGVFYDVTEQKRASEELDLAHARLIESSRQAGMAEVATGVLHNVGNVLNSVNVSGNVISERLRSSKVVELGKVAGLLTLQAADFAGFVARDPRGPHIPELISRVAEALQTEHADLLEEVGSITRNIGHIKEIVSMQQGFAKGEGIVEPLAIQAVVDDAIKINSMSLTRHRIAVVQAFEEVPRVLADKHLVLQILVNLLRNAKQAIEHSGREERRIVVKIQSNGGEFVKITVQDSGGGIAPENLTRIFSHGFTTKKTGHGFGLHSSALAATGMGGALSATSDGPGLGATFSLDLPVSNPLPAAAAA